MDSGVSNSKYPAIRILTGIHQGGELTLPPGEYVIGSSDQCDIILHDDQVLDRHCLLESDGDRVTLTLLDEGQGLVGGNPVTKEKQVLKDYEPVTLGTMNFAVGPIGGKWPVIQTYTFTPDDQQDERDKAALLGRLKGKNKKRKSRKAVIVFLLVCLCGILVFTIAYITVRKMHAHQRRLATVREHNIDKLKELIGSMKDSNVKLTLGRDGVPKLTGMVASNEEKQKLIKAVKTISPKAVVSVKSEAILQQAIENSLAVVGFPEVRVTLQGEGNVFLTGMLHEKKGWKEALAAVKGDFAQVNLQDDTVTFREIQGYLEGLLDKNNLKVSVIPRMQDNEIELQGPSDSEGQQRAAEVVAEFNRKYRDMVEVKLIERIERETVPQVQQVPQVTGICDENIPVKLPFQVTAFNAQGVKYLLLKNEGKFFKGAYLPGGTKLIDITEDAVTLSYRECVYNIPFGGIQ